MAMDTPARFESLLWMASPMMAWAQASAEAPPSKPAAAIKPAARAQATAPRAARKRRKAIA
jgi:hypothetical protein